MFVTYKHLKKVINFFFTLLRFLIYIESFYVHILLKLRKKCYCIVNMEREIRILNVKIIFFNFNFFLLLVIQLLELLALI